MLTPTRQELRRLLEGALALDPVRREALIRDALPSDGSARSDEVLRQLQDGVLRLIEACQTESVEDPDADRTRLKDDATDVLEAVLGNQEAEKGFLGTNRFDLRRRLGSGGFGAVYECFDRERQTRVALKVLRRTDPAFLYRFKREFRALVDVKHPNLVEIYELFADSRSWFFTMELVEGVNFLDYVYVRQVGSPAPIPAGPLCDVERLRAAALQLARGIAALHGADMLHRDIKPANVLVSSDGRVRLLDFGLVQESRRDEHQTIYAGTPAYMSPEQAACLPLAESSDWYSFGLILFQALTGILPASDRTSARRPVAPESPSAIAPAVPEDLDHLCRDLLTIDPACRPSGALIIERLGGRTVHMEATPTVRRGAEERPIGRDAHLVELEQLLAATSDGQAVVVNLHGKSGIGKTTLLRAFQQQIAREDPSVVILAGRCHESELVPFKALDDLIDALSRYLKGLPEADAEALAPRDAQSLVRVFPVLAQAEAITRTRRRSVEVLDTQELRWRAFGSLQDLFGRLADKRTLLLSIDDLQWGDLDSAAFLAGMLTSASPPACLLIASYRSEDADASPFLQTWRASLASAKAVTVRDLEVAELTPAASIELASRLVAQRGGDPRASAESIAQESGGSPFLIDQIARYRGPGQLNEAADDGPVSIQHVIVHQVNALPDGARRLVETLALAGQPLGESVAFDAAGLVAAGHSSLSTLVAEHLVRLRETRGAREAEVYHDRIRQAIIATMPADRRQGGHRELALALERQGAPDPAVLAMHFKEAGDHAAAATYALTAAEHAAGALAFDRAVQLYRLALDEGRWEPERAVKLQRKLAEALVHAGRGVEGARAYQDASSGAGSAERLELRRLAAEQLLRSGHIDEGLRSLHAVAKSLGVWPAEQPWQALLSVMWNRARIAARGLRFRERPLATISDHDLAVLDLYWTFAIGLLFVDMVRGADFQARHLMLALRVGERNRLAMSLALEAANLAASRGRSVRRIRDLFASARALTEGTTHPQALGLIATCEVMSAVFAADWKPAQDLSERADRVLREQCTGVAWERGTNAGFAMVAAWWLGNWQKITADAQNLPKLLQEARARGDMHEVFARLSVAPAFCLATDQPDQVESLVREEVGHIPGNGFYLPQFFALKARVETALYQNAPTQAWDLVTAAWPALSRSLLLRAEELHIEALDLRGRAAVAVGTARQADGRRHLREAIRCARKLERVGTPASRGFGLLIRAGVASEADRRADIQELLIAAERLFGGLQMMQYVAAAQYRRGTTLDGPEGPALVASAREWASSQGVVAAPRVFDMLLPGRWG